MTAKPRTAEQLDARALARTRLEAMRRRTRRIRRSVAGLALALFAASFTIVFVQLASGHDPSLVANARKRAAAASATSSAGGESASGESSSVGESSATGESSSASESGFSESGESSTGASAVTTSQS